MSRRSKKEDTRQPKAATVPAGTSAPPGRDDPGPGQIAWGPSWLPGLLLVLATFLAYQQVWHAGFIWDDDAHVVGAGLRSWHGLWRIWFEPGATQQYYPVLYTAFWVEHRLWADSALGYHLANVILHLAAAGLLYRVLRRLAVPGAGLAAAVFALHPVGVESVAWISEQKNTLSTVFYLLAGLAYLRYDRERRAGWYALGLGLFVLALLSKTVTASLPAALLVVFWWQRGRLAWRSDGRPLLPWLGLGAAAGAMTAWFERTYVGASGADYALGFGERFLVAGRVIWFYLGKIFWPADLIFIYPRWAVDVRDPGQFLYPAAAIVVLAGLLVWRKRDRGPLAVALLFAGTLFPALGFINVFPFVYSYVADHFQYLAMAMVFAGAAAVFTRATGRLSSGGRLAAGGAAVCLLALLAALTWRQCAMYAGKETLWRTTIARNPVCSMAYNNLGAVMLETGRVDEAIANIRTALKFGPGNAAAYSNLGNALLQKGEVEAACVQYRQALAIEPDDVMAHNNFGTALLQAGRVDEAVAHYQRALKGKPDFARAQTNLGDVYLQTDRVDEAMALYHQALANDPGDVEAHTNLGLALVRKNRLDEAIAQLQAALGLNPDFVTARTNLGNVLLQTGRVDEAIGHYRMALQIDPRSIAAHQGLGIALTQKGRSEEAKAHFEAAAAPK